MYFHKHLLNHHINSGHVHLITSGNLWHASEWVKSISAIHQVAALQATVNSIKRDMWSEVYSLGQTVHMAQPLQTLHT